MLLTSTPSTEPGNDTTIDYEAKRNQFVVKCPAYANGRVRDLPNRRWDSNNRVWRAPALMANARVLSMRFSPQCFTKIAEEKLRAMLDKKEPELRPFPSTFPFKTEPMEKQRVALDRFFDRKAIALFMDMGTGKTKVVIDLMGAWISDSSLDRTVVISPMGVRRTWIREFATHSIVDHDVHVLDSSKEKAFNEWNVKRHASKVLIVAVESLSAGKAIDLCKRFMTLSTKTLAVVDESSRIKTPTSTRTERVISIGRMAERRLIMNGTPIANGLVDLFSQYEFLDPDIIGTGDVYSFKARYCVMGGYEDREIVGYQNADELMELIKPYTFLVKSEEVQDLPPIVFLRREVKLSAEHAAVYKEINRKAIVGMGTEKNPITNTLTKSLRLQQIANGIGIDVSRTTELDAFKEEIEVVHEKERWLGSAKLDDLISVADDNPDKQFIVWCLYKSQLYAIRDALVERYGRDAVVELHGDISEEQRDVNVYELFQKRKARFCVGNVATGGIGLTMTECDVMCFMSNSFSLIDREQAVKRGHRKGRVGTMVVIDFVTEGTVDVDACDALAMKLDFADYVKLAIKGQVKMEGVQL